jgi:signal transduction histidine kinase
MLAGCRFPRTFAVAALCAAVAANAFCADTLAENPPSGAPVNPLGVLELRDASSSVEILPHALAAVERGGLGAPRRLSFKPDASVFSPALPEVLGGFVAADAAWITFTVLSAASARSWIIEAGPNSLDSVSVYIVDPNGSIEHMTSDAYSRPGFSTRSLSEFCFRLTIGPGEVKTVYMRFAAEGPLSVKARLWDSFAYLRKDEGGSILIGFAIGVIIAVFFYTLFIALSLRDSAYAFYLVYLAALVCLVLVESGPGSALLRVGAAWGERRGIPFYSSVMCFGMALFTRRFLGMKHRSGLLSVALFVVAAFVPLYDFGLAFLDLRSITLAGVGIDAVARCLILAAAIASVAGGGRRREAYFLAAWVFAATGSVVSRLSVFGLIESPSLLPDNAEVIGAVFQILILAYGITDAINAMRTETEAGQLRSIELLERANRVKEDFVIGTSLEFRSPLYGIVGLVDALEDLSGDHSSPEEKRLSSLIRAEAQRLLGSAANIATFARLRNDDIAVQAERVSLREVADYIATSVAHIASGKDIGVETRVADVVLETDGRLLSQIIFNLFSDAIKRSPSGIVTIEGTVDGSIVGQGSGARVRFVVIDSAPPLPDEQLARFLFAGDGVGKEGVGPGLSLLVARLLASRLGGSLSYSWEAGRGRFELELPRSLLRAGAAATAPRAGLPFQGWLQARAARQASADLSETPQGPTTRGLVLAYDEDPVFLEALKRYLEGRGYAVAPTVSADNAVAMADSRRFDLVLLDASGQGRTGLAACSRIRASHGMGDLPVVVMTDRDSAEAVEAAFRAGASDYLPKLSPNELLFARVDTHVALRRSLEEALETRKRIAELEKLKTLGVLATGVAHEVNTPNNAIIRNMPVISEVWRELAPSVQRLMKESEGFSIGGWSAEELMRELPELLSDTYNAGLQIKKIVEDLKDYARDSSSLPPENVDLSAVAAYAARLLQPLVAKSTRAFVLDAPSGLPLVKANFQKLTQVAVNVLENALQSLPGPDAGVRLSTRFDARRLFVVLECADQGKGIDRVSRDKIFEPFFTTKRDSGGTGLGLSVSLGIVRDAGGEIEVESQQGKGTTVRVVLPAAFETEMGEDGRRA